MTTSPPDPDRFAIIPIYSDSTGNGAIPTNAVAHGSWSAITGRIRDSKQQRQMLTLINDAEHARGALAGIRAREQAIAAREDAVSTMEDDIKRTLLADFTAKIDSLTARIDAMEAERARDPDDDELPLPPATDTSEGLEAFNGGSASHGDDGHLQSPIAAPLGPEPDLANEDQSRAAAALQD